MIREVLKKAVRVAGYEIHKADQGPDAIPVEFTKADVDVLRFVADRKLTMVSRQRLIATINACKHAVLTGTPGDFIECGVWRGGNALAAKLTFENYGSSKHVYLFDTFAGMTAPTEHDTSRFETRPTAEQFGESLRDGRSNWCYASIEDVRSNLLTAGIDFAGVHFIQGDVVQTLQDSSHLPDSIAVLRLDTDFYESTKAEMEILYPRLSRGGSLLIDDFGYWDGSRKAIVEYLAEIPAERRPLLHFTDGSGRMGVKP